MRLERNWEHLKIKRCDRQNNALPSRLHILIPGTCEYVTLHSKRDFADVRKDVETGRVSWVIQVGPM